MTAARHLFFLPILAMLTLLPGCAEAGPASTVENFYGHVEAGELDQAAHLVAPELIAMFGRDKLDSGLSDMNEEILESGGIESIDILSEEISEQEATLKVRVNYLDGGFEEEDIQLTNIDGEWKLTMTK